MVQRTLDLGIVQRVWVLVPTWYPGTNYLITSNETAIVMCHHHDIDVAIPRAAISD